MKKLITLLLALSSTTFAADQSNIATFVHQDNTVYCIRVASTSNLTGAVVLDSSLSVSCVSKDAIALDKANLENAKLQKEVLELQKIKLEKELKTIGNK